MKIRNRYGYEGIRKLYGDIMKIVNTPYASLLTMNMSESYVKLNRETRKVELVTPDTRNYDVRIPLTSLLSDIEDTDEITMRYIAQKLNKLTEGE